MNHVHSTATVIIIAIFQRLAIVLVYQTKLTARAYILFEYLHIAI